MAQQENVAPVGGVNNQPRTAPVADNKDARQAEAKNETKKANGDDEAPPTEEELELTQEAERQMQAEQERKAAEEQQKLEDEQERQQQELDAKMREIEQVKQELQQAQEAGDKDKVETLTQKLHLLEADLGAMFDAPPITNAARDTGAGQLPQMDFMPRPPGGGMNMGGQIPNFGAMGGIPGLGGPPAGVSTQGPLATPRANPTAEIPDFGKNASKAEIGKMLDGASEKYGIPPNILKAVAWQESGWNPKALSFDGQHGKGVMQIDDRFHDFAKTPDVFDPKKNIEYGAKFLSDLYAKTGSWEQALKRYNGGSTYPPKVLALAERQPWTQHA